MNREHIFGLQEAIDEKKVLGARIDALGALISSHPEPGSKFAALPKAEQELLWEQFRGMIQLQTILGRRIALADALAR
ncbi:crAss001_48 related protein [Burkholderia latens]|uniref:crAss001_48 related protein n=1 Tax=Burkholderia latens TaxID=488446 RepID=UPI001AE90A1D|nr:hypothetical protein [Burkholderia latens]QTO42175.1 hypothetical protein J8I85_08695 [Burkholderia latens]